MKHWYALYVNSRSEKKVADRLKNLGWEVFCPLKTELRQWSDRKKKVTVPYFHSYLFLRCSLKEDKSQILQAPGVVCFVFWLGAPAVIRDKEMESVITFFEDNAKSVIVSESIQIGKSYEIAQGALAGKSGVVVWQNAHRATLEIPYLNMRFSVEKKMLIPDKKER